MTKIKICGLTREQDILAVNEAKPDYIGFVFVPNRKRTVTKETAKRLKQLLSKDIKVVGVFLNNDVEEVISLAKEGIIDMIQLHGDEDQTYIQYVNIHTDVPIIKAVSAKNRELIEKSDMLQNIDYLLLDTYDKIMVGGTGKTFDWNIIPKLKTPYFLAGGLNVNNIRFAMQTGAYALDVSSGAETNGLKDAKKILEIVKIVRGG